MSKKIVPYLIVPTALILIALGTLSAFWESKNGTILQQQVSERINLALRQTAHRLLKQAGDSTSIIAAVKKTTNNAYLIRLDHPFNYDSLPVFLHNSFAAYNIKSKFDVAVWDCKNEELVLGYSSLDFLNGAGVPCVGRNQAMNCSNFTVTFTDLPLISSKIPSVWFLLSGLIVLIIALIVYVFYFFSNKKKTLPPSQLSPDFFGMFHKDVPSVKSLQTDETHLVFIGHTLFDTHHQTVSIGDSQQKLTFREAKLLQLFCHHKNELLERDFILQQVWEDEGIMVGRSVDVFVSRLRKILKNDTTLKITNVHSRGYRFETMAAG